MSTPYRFGRQSNASQLQYSLPAPRVAKPPIHNPYDKFTQREFDAWIGDITSSLKRALGEEELQEPPKISNEDVDSSSDDDEHVASQLLLDDADEESVDEAADDTFAEIRAMRVLGKGKARDPREGPGLGKGDQAQPIEILSDSDEEEQSSPPARMASDEIDEDEDAHYEEYDQDGEDEGSDDLTGEDVSEEEEEDEGLPWDGGESSAQALQRHLAQARYLQQRLAQDGDFGDEEDSQNEGAYLEEDEEVYEEDELGSTPQEYSSDLRYHAQTKSQSPDEDVILVESSDEEKGVVPTGTRESQEHSDVEHSDDLYAEQRSSPPGPTLRERVSESPENDHEIQSSPHQYDENLEEEEEKEEEGVEEERVDDDVFGPEDEEMEDEIIEVEDNEQQSREPTPDEMQPLANDTSFPPHESISVQAVLPIEILDPWLGPQTYAQDYYSGGELRPGLSMNAHQLGPEDVDEVQEVLDHGSQDVEMNELISNTLVDVPSPFPQDLFVGPPITDAPEHLIFPQIQPMETPTYPESLEGEINSLEERPESQISVSTPSIKGGEIGTSIATDNDNKEAELFEGVGDEGYVPRTEINEPLILDTLNQDLFTDLDHSSGERDPVLDISNLPQSSDSPYVPTGTPWSNIQDEERVVEVADIPNISDAPVPNKASDDKTETQKDEEPTTAGVVEHDVLQVETGFSPSQDNSLHRELPDISVENGAAVQDHDQSPMNIEETTKPSDTPFTPELKDEHPVIEVTVIQDDGNGEVQPAIVPVEESPGHVQVPSIEIIDTEMSQPSSPPPDEPSLLHSLSAGIQINIIEATPNVTPTPSPILHDFDEIWDDNNPHFESIAEPVIAMDWKADDDFIAAPSLEYEVVATYGVEEPPFGPLASNVLHDRMESPENLGVEVLEVTHSNVDEYISIDGLEDSGLASAAETLEQDKVEGIRDSLVPSNLEDLQVRSIEGIESNPTSSDGHPSEIPSLSLLSPQKTAGESPSLSEERLIEEAMDGTPSKLPDSMMDLAASPGDQLMTSPTLDAPLPEAADPALEGIQLPPSVTEQPLTSTVAQPDVVHLEEAGQYESDHSQVTIAEDDFCQSRFGALFSETKVGSVFVGEESKTATQQDSLSQDGPDDLKVVIVENTSHDDAVSSTVIIEDTTSSKVHIEAVSAADKKEHTPESTINQPPALETIATFQNEADQSLQTQEEASFKPSSVSDPKPDDAAEPVAGIPPSLEHSTNMGPDVTTELTQKVTRDLDERCSKAGDEAQTSLPEVSLDTSVSKPPNNAGKPDAQTGAIPGPAHNEANNLHSQVNGSSSTHVFSSVSMEEGIPVQMFTRGPAQPLLMADPYPWSLSTPRDPYTGPRYTAYDSEAGSPVTSSSSASTADNILDPQLQQDKPLENGTTNHTDTVPGGHSENVASSAPHELPSEATSLSPRLLTTPSSSNAARGQHGSSNSYKQSPSNKDNWKKQPDALQSSPRSSISGPRISSVEPQAQNDEELPSILIIKKPSPTKPSDQQKQEEQSPSLKRKREPATPAIPSSTSKKGPGKPRGKKGGKAEASQPPKKASKPRKEKGKGKEAGQPDIRSTSSRDSPSRASSIASSVPSEVAHQSSPSIALKEPQFRPPAPPPLRTMPPSLMHRHSHALPQSSSVHLPPPRSSSHRHAGSEATPSRSQATSQRERGSFTSYSSPVTRSNCRYHKISIPRDEDGPRIMFLVPGCTLGDQELMEEEEINDLGDATVEDTRDIIQDLDSLDFEPYLIGVLRQLVGAKMLQEREVYYMSRKGEDGKDLVARKSSWSPRKGRSHLQHAEHSSKAAESPTTPTGAHFAGLDSDSSSASEEEEDEYQPPKKTRGTVPLSRRATHPAPSASSRGVKRTNASVNHDQELDAARQAKKQKTNGGEEHAEPGPAATYPFPPPAVFVPFSGTNLHPF